MSGHNKWKQIKHKKAIEDKKRAQIFSKLLRAISTTAEEEKNPKLNPRLKSLIEQAKTAKIPINNIERARTGNLSRQETKKGVLVEGYAPGGISLVVKISTKNKNRAVQEIKSAFKKFDAKWAERGSAIWNFKKTPTGELTPVLIRKPKEEDAKRAGCLIRFIKRLDGVQKIYTDLNQD